MFTTLIVSGPRTRGAWRRQLPGTTFSMAAHAAVVYAAVMATMTAGPRPSSGVGDTQIVYIPSQTTPEPRAPSLPQHFQTVVAPVTIPTSIPPIDMRQTFDPGAYSGVGVDSGPAPGLQPSSSPTQVFIEAMVDEAPVRVAFPPPEYPRMPLEARIEGTVVLEAIIDTLGHPEPGSIRVITSTHRAFEAAATAAMRRALYQPGRVQGHRVRVLVRQPVRFALPR
jgi:TonB family protein